MNILTYKEVENLLLKNELKFYNFYNSDIEPKIFLATQHYSTNTYDTAEVDQLLNIVFCDIEVYHEDRSLKFEFDKSDHPVSAITFYETKNKIYRSYFLLRPINKQLFNLNIDNYYKYLREEKYINDNDTVEVFTYENEIDLIINCWNDIKQRDPHIISGFNSDFFDYPYIYRRLLKLNGNNKDHVANILSRFGYVEFKSERLKIPDFPICDLLYLYKPREDGGLGLGQKQASYSLDSISEIELKRNKINYKGQVNDFVSFYENNPIEFLLYNIVDVALCVQLNNKLKHIELQNSLRRMMKTTFSNSLIGSSALFESFTYFKLYEANSKVRHGLVTQNNKTIDESLLVNIKRPIQKKGELAPTTIKSRDYISLVSKFDGAYVREPKAQIVNGTIIDLDASIPHWETITILRDGVEFKIGIGDYEFKEKDKTLTWDNSGNICWATVKGKLSHPWTFKHGKILKITTVLGYSCFTTDNHSIFTIQQDSNKRIPYIIDAKDLKLGDYVVCFNGKTKTKMDKIIDIMSVDYDGLVYDLSVDQYERFFATSIGVHNTSLYPSKILESNIGFDTYQARVINPNVYKFLAQLEGSIGIKDISNDFGISILKLIEKYIENNKKKITNQNKFKQYWYFTIMFLLTYISNSNIPMKNIFEPKTDEQYYLLMFYVLPLLDAINTLHPNKDAHNLFIYDYLFKNELEVRKNFPIVYIINNAGGCAPFIKKYNTEDAIKFIQNYSFTICGTCFLKHEVKLGLYSDMLKTLSSLRKEYRKKAEASEVNSKEYEFNNRNQLAIKRVANSSYGVYGLSSFRYSNHWLAQSITSQGRLTLKISQYLTEQFLSNYNDR